MLELFTHLMHSYNLTSATLEGGKETIRHLSQLADSFQDVKAYQARLEEGDPVVYRVSAVEPAEGPGDLHFGLGTLYPGKVGQEYFLTKGHYHSRREAAEVYIGLAGAGRMLLEDENSGESRLEELGQGQVVYVPGYTAHRTINVGTKPLVYFGIYPADAGHDYGAIAERNFLKVLVDEGGEPVLRDRDSS